MSKNDLAYNFLSGISLTNAPKQKEKHSTPSKNTLRESQAHFVSPTKTQPSVKTTHRDKEATSFLSSISLGGGEKEQEENVPAAPIERRRKTSGTHKRKDILSPKFVLKTYSKNPHNMRLLIANSKSAGPLYCFSLIKYNSEEIPQLKRKKSYENKIENQTSNSTTPAFNDQIEHKAISYDYLLGSSWINKANIDQNEEFSINNNQSLNSSSNINTINTSNNSTNSSNNTSNTNNISSSQYLPNQDVDFAYDPHFLDDPDLKTGKHRTVLNLPGFRGSIIPFITPEDLKEELNEQFRQKHSWIDHSTGVTLHKLRKLKRKLLEIALDKDLEPSTVALAYVFIDKLVLKNVIGKENLNLIGGVCLLLAIKFNDQKLDKQGVRQTLEIIEKYIEISPKEILEEEFKVFASLSFSLFVDPQDVMPHHQRLLSQIEAFKSDKEEE